jgi:hypothetical protein
MAFTVSTGELLERVQKFVETRLDDGWVAEPPAARLALLVREELGRWTAATYPGSSLELAALEPGSRRRLSITIHSAPVTHRVEIWGLACGDEREAAVPAGEHAAHSWVVLAHLGGACANAEAHARKLSSTGLKRIEARESPSLSLALWMGAAAPDGCPACRQGR